MDILSQECTMSGGSLYDVIFSDIIIIITIIIIIICLSAAVVPPMESTRFRFRFRLFIQNIADCIQISLDELDMEIREVPSVAVLLL